MTEEPSPPAEARGISALAVARLTTGEAQES